MNDKSMKFASEESKVIFGVTILVVWLVTVAHPSNTMIRSPETAPQRNWNHWAEDKK